MLMRNRQRGRSCSMMETSMPLPCKLASLWCIQEESQQPWPGLPLPPRPSRRPASMSRILADAPSGPPVTGPGRPPEPDPSGSTMDQRLPTEGDWSQRVIFSVGITV